MEIDEIYTDEAYDQQYEEGMAEADEALRPDWYGEDDFDTDTY